MKTFLYSTEYKQQKYGQRITATVYQLKKNKPVYIGEVVMYTQAMMGFEGEINKFLIENKIIPRTWQRDKNGSGYVDYNTYGHDKKYYFYKI